MDLLYTVSRKQNNNIINQLKQFERYVYMYLFEVTLSGLKNDYAFVKFVAINSGIPPALFCVFFFL